MAHFKTKIDRFDGGMVDDARDSRENVCRLSLGFNTNLVPGKIVPYRESEDGDVAATTSQKQNFALALRTGTTYSLYALGVKSGTGLAEVLYKNLTTNAANDLDDNTWATPSNNQATTGATKFGLFTYYRQTGLVYGAQLNKLWAFSPSGSAWTDDIITDDGGSPFSFTNIEEGLVHSADDILYIPYDNKIAKNDNGTWTNEALVLPSNLRITSISERGNYLAIATEDLSGVGNSVVYLWDRDSSLTTISQKIDWGSGKLKVIGELDDTLIGISFVGGISSVLDDRVIFRVNGKRFLELSGTSSTILKTAKQRIDNRLFFMMSITIDGVKREGVWSIGRSSIDSPFSLVFERPLDNDTAVGNATLRNFIYVNDFLFQSYVDGGTEKMSKTIKSDTFTNLTAKYITNFNPQMTEGQKTSKKQLVAVRLMSESLPTAGQLVLKTSVDGAADVTAFTETTNSNLVTENEGPFIEGYEYRFTIESTGGAVPTSLECKYKLVGSQL